MITTHSNRGGVVAVAVAVLALSMRCAFAVTEHHVGSGTCDADPSWSSTSKCDFNAWSQKQDFVVGDSIVFTFTYGDSNVALVSQQDYFTCTTSGVMPTTYINYWSVSPLTLNLPGAGTFYFISNLNTDDCTATNLKMAITVKTAAGTAAPPSNSPPSPSAIPIVIIVPTPAPSGNHKSSIVGPVVGGTVGFVFLAAKLALIAYCTEKRREARKKKKQEDADKLKQESGSGTAPALGSGGDLVKGVPSSLKGNPDNSGKGSAYSKGNRDNSAKDDRSSNSDHEDAHSHV